MAKHGLPTDVVRENIATTFVVRASERVIRSAAAEMHADGTLLRSVAVALNVKWRVEPPLTREMARSPSFATPTRHRR
jgi:hypothetical protein